ncbi:MAG: TolC family protein [Prevotella sp.]|nr:TolC family protein [Prevotella sp.]
MNKFFGLLILAGAVLPSIAQEKLSLDSCRALALLNNKQLSISKLKQDVAHNARKAAHTKYLPHVNALGSYMHMNKEISILDDEQKESLSNFGSNVGSAFTSDLTPVITQMAQSGIITPQQAQSLGQGLQKAGTSLSNALNQAGQKIRDDFRTDTRNIYTASVMFTQPIYMGGKIIAVNRLAEYTEQFTFNDTEAKQQAIIYDIDNAYWTVVSLSHKQKLSQSYLQLVKKLDSDVNKMIKEGVATRSDGLKVDVKLNEAEMMQTQVDDGLELSKMYLCQLCGLPMDEKIKLVDEETNDLNVVEASYDANTQVAMDARPELKMLKNAVDMSKEVTKIIRADFLPQLALTGGYTMTNPNLYNGFERKFSGFWSIGVMLTVPVWNWGEGVYKVRAARGATNIADMELSDAREKVELQVNQNSFKVKEANKRYTMASKNTERADENLRCATLGFKEGVIQSSTVLEAQTAWLQAQSQKIDAGIEVKLTQVGLKKALGILQ